MARKEDRSDEAVRAATELFLEHGYAGVSVNAVIARVGGSKRDLYAKFGDKEGLFRRVIAGVCQDVMGPLQELPEGEGSVDDALLAFGCTFLRFLLTPRVVALQRLVMTEATRYPEFAKTFVQYGPSSAYEVAAALLTERARRGEILIGPPRILGALFCDMLIAELQFRVIAGEAVSAADVKKRVRLAVSTFLNGVRGRSNRINPATGIEERSPPPDA